MALKKKGIRSKYNNHQFEAEKSEDYTGHVSQTIQGEAVPLDQFIVRYTRGDIPPMAQQAFNNLDLDDDIPDFYQDKLTRQQEMVNAQKMLQYQLEQKQQDVQEEQYTEGENDQNEQPKEEQEIAQS